jgi:cobyrinic acid a,c-diamide synthase
MKIPRFLIAAGASGSGKTLVTCGLLQAYLNRGRRIASFKCGPDYIDPMFHSQVLGTKSRNLDSFFTGEEETRQRLIENAEGYDLAVMEGVMGFYDGVAGISTRASAYDVARITDTPVLLLVNCKGMSVSVAAYIEGFMRYKEDSHIKGILLNQLSPMMYDRMKTMIEEQLSIPVFGYIPKVEDCILESRHLGLVMPEEIDDLQEKLKKLAGILEKTVDLDGIEQLAGQAPDLEKMETTFQMKKWSVSQKVSANTSSTISLDMNQVSNPNIRIGVAKDEAFCFFYEDNLQLLKKMGAELIYFSPIHDEKIPEKLDGLLLNGGYPELYARKLGENKSMRQSVRDMLTGGLPCIAECGGFLYLHDQMEDKEGTPYPMVGVISGEAHYTGKLSRFGYITLSEGTAFGQNVGPMPAHEFHYYDSTNCGESFLAEKPLSKRSWRCIHTSDTLLAGFPHNYFYGNIKLAEAFYEKCVEYRRKREDET